MASYRMRPQVGMSGGKPRPRNDRVDSAMMAAATSMVAGDDHRAQRVGQDVAHHLARLAGAERARRLDELLLAQREELRAHEPRHRHPAQAADDDDDQDEDAALRPEHALEGVLEEIDHEQQQRQRRQRQEEVGEPHQAGADRAARHAGNGADDGADDDGDDHGGEADRQRDAPAVEHARQQVLAEIVGAERMRPRGPLEARREIDLVDRHAPQRTARAGSPATITIRMMPLANGQAVAAEPPPRLQPRREMPCAACTGVPASAEGNAWVEPAIEDIGDQVEEDDEAGEHERHRHDDRRVVGEDRADQQRADARERGRSAR